MVTHSSLLHYKPTIDLWSKKFRQEGKMSGKTSTLVRSFGVRVGSPSVWLTMMPSPHKCRFGFHNLRFSLGGKKTHQLLAPKLCGRGVEWSYTCEYVQRTQVSHSRELQPSGSKGEEERERGEKTRFWRANAAAAKQWVVLRTHPVEYKYFGYESLFLSKITPWWWQL